MWRLDVARGWDYGLRQVEKLVAPPAIAARRRLRRFHEQVTQQAVALFTDMV